MDEGFDRTSALAGAVEGVDEKAMVRDAFSYPPSDGGAGPGTGEDLLAEVVGEHVRALVRRLVEVHGAQLALRSETAAASPGSPPGRAAVPGVIDLLTHWLKGPIELGCAWTPAFGPLREVALNAGSRDPGAPGLASAAQFGLHLSACGVEYDWSACLDATTTLRFGELILPPTRRLQVTTDGGSIRIALDGDSHTLSRLPDGTLQGGASLRRLPVVERRGARLTLLTDAAESTWNSAFTAESRSVGGARAVADQCSAGLTLIDDYAPAWSRWVSAVGRELTPLDGSDGTMRSGSVENRPGQIGMSFPSTPVQVGEMFVHECSHQRFHIAKCLGRMVDVSHTKLYPSPIKRCDRPLEAILLAYHAFANVLLFYRSCLARGLDDGGYCQSNIERHGPELEQLARPLRESDGLSDLGRALWGPLAEQLG